MFDVIIVGGGVAAFTSALFCGRRGLKVLVIGKDVGGQANYTDLIENYPGIFAIGGYELVTNIKKQAENTGIEFIEAQVQKVKKTEQGFVITAYNNQYKSKSLILAFGKTPRDLGVPGEEELKGKGVSYCATCDAPLFKSKTVAVAGVGDINLDAILLCAKYAKKVYALSKTDKLSGHPALLKAVTKKNNIELVPFIQIQEILGNGSLEKIKLMDLKTGSQKNITIDGLFVELGYAVDSQFVADLVQLDGIGQIVVDNNQATSVPGVYACGDSTHSTYKQAVISAGEAATASLAVYDYLVEGSNLTSDWTQIKKLK